MERSPLVALFIPRFVPKAERSALRLAQNRATAGPIAFLSARRHDWQDVC
jgi:hypothetical protein